MSSLPSGSAPPSNTCCSAFLHLPSLFPKVPIIPRKRRHGPDGSGPSPPLEMVGGAEEDGRRLLHVYYRSLLETIS